MFQIRIVFPLLVCDLIFVAAPELTFKRLRRSLARHCALLPLPSPPGAA